MIRGSIPALVTPFLQDLSIDWDSLFELIDWHVESGSSAIVLLGTTGESPTITQTERQELIRRCHEHLQQRIPLIVGTGHYATSEAIQRTLEARALGADMCLVVTPYYNRPTQKGLLQHFQAIADQSEVPVLLYSVPKRTGCQLAPETIAKLSAHERIIGIKHDSPDTEEMHRIADLADDDFLHLSGNDAIVEDYLSEGGDGMISVVANLIPDFFSTYCDHLLELDEESSLPLRYSHLIDAMGWESNPIPVKWALWHMGRIKTPQLRSPLTTLSMHYQQRLQDLLKAL